MSASTRSTFAVIAALVLSTLWSAASAIAVLLGIAHIIDPLAPPPPARLVTPAAAGRRSRRPSPRSPGASPSASPGAAFSASPTAAPRPREDSLQPPRPAPPSRADSEVSDIELLISPTLTDEPASFLSPDDREFSAPPSISISRSPSPPGSRMKRMFSFDPSTDSTRGRSPLLSPSLSEGDSKASPVAAPVEKSPKRVAKDRHVVSAEIARAAWVRPHRSGRAKGVARRGS